MIFKNELVRIEGILEDRERCLISELKSLPDGSLYIKFVNGQYYYYERFPKGGNRKKEHRFGISKDPDKVLQLVRKRYIEDALVSIRQDKKILKSAIEQFRLSDENSVMKDFLNQYPHLSDGVFYNRIQMQEWVDSYTPDESFFAEDLKSMSHDGVKMRSNAELYITARLNHYGIPHRYEAPLAIPDLRYHPDFTILRPRDRKIIYWEHIGMVGDYIYVRDSVEKVLKYIDYGITPWDNLITTFSNEDGSFNAKVIEAMIKGWLL